MTDASSRKESASEPFDNFYTNAMDKIHIPSMEVARLSLSLGKLANQDAVAALLLNTKKLYGLSMFHLQQSVEKAVKGFGLLIDILQPEDLINEVRHNSVIAVILNVDRLMDQAYSIFSPFMSLDFEHVPFILSPLAKQMRELQKQLEKPLQSIASTDETGQKRKLESALEEVRDYKGKFGTDERMWKATLNLDENEELVALALKNRRLQKDNKFLWKFVRAAFPLISRMKKRQDGSFNSKEASLKMKFMTELYSKGPKVLPLCILTEWHEQEPRYPRIRNGDYWDPESYNSEEPLVKLSRQLIRESLSLSESVTSASELALEIYGIA